MSYEDYEYEALDEFDTPNELGALPRSSGRVDRDFRAAERMRATRSRLEERAARKNELLALLPDAPGTVIYFEIRLANGITYLYAAIAFMDYAHVNSLRWATTGPKAPKSYTTEEIVNWLCNNDLQELWVATEWTEV